MAGAALSQTSTTDTRFMRAALGLARRGLGRTWPNPSVGCVIVDETGAIIGRGWTQTGGRPHAETEALKQAGARAKGATAYVTLEPCAHFGKTPPCADALIAAGIARVVVAITDPDPRTAGQGLARLRGSGIAVSEGTCTNDAREVTAGFLTRIEKGRPYFILKSATTMDGRIAAHTGASQWITGEAARARGHLMRAESDAVMIGIGTAMADDPMLDVRLPGLQEYRPVRIVADGQLRLPLTSKLVTTAQSQPLWIITRPGADAARTEALKNAGAEIIQVATIPSGALDLPAAARELAARGLTRVLVEGGGQLAASMIHAGLIDRIAAFRAGRVMGGDGLPAIAAMSVASPDAAPRFTLRHIERVGEDVLETWDAHA